MCAACLFNISSYHSQLAMKEAETAQFNAIIDEKEQFIADLQAQGI